ncbi:MAG: nitrate- and nitrite sensing domain-containing protein [Candidatus Marithrix sp.]|nr:nitrate- and nitrite sensing domain-containing protein [Candidatus Marithrix sp.]
MMLKNIKTTNKLAVMLAIPMLGLVYFTVTITLEKLNIVQQMNILQKFSEITIKSSTLIHELQKERGISAGLISSNGNKLFPNLQKQRLKTNEAKLKLNNFLTDFHTIEIRNKFQTGFALLADIENKRNLIDGFNMSVEQQVQYYNEVIATLLNNINHLPQKIDIIELHNKITAYIYLLRAKEKSGIERAILYSSLIQSNFNLELHKEITLLIEAQNIYIKEFLSSANDTQQQFYHHNMRGKFIETVKQIRKDFFTKKFYSSNNKKINFFKWNNQIKLLNYGSLKLHESKLNPIHWWEASTGRINLLKQIGDKISSDLIKSASIFKQKAQTIFFTYLIFTIAIILLTFFYARIVLQKTNQAYSRFVPNELLQLLNKNDILNIQLGNNVELKMTVLFSDIRSFTSLSEKMSPQENFDFINAYLSEIIPIIHNNNGIIDKFIGDAIMALFVNADDAVNAAIGMVEVQKHQGIETGIGLNTGDLMLGIIGEDKRLQCTVISDSVNVASRLENLTKTYKVPLIISQNTIDNLADTSLYKYKLIDNIKVKGRSEYLNIFEVS